MIGPLGAEGTERGGARKQWAETECGAFAGRHGDAQRKGKLMSPATTSTLGVYYTINLLVTMIPR